jgi:hypothetical protein
MLQISDRQHDALREEALRQWYKRLTAWLRSRTPEARSMDELRITAFKGNGGHDPCPPCISPCLAGMTQPQMNRNLLAATKLG